MIFKLATSCGKAMVCFGLISAISGLKAIGGGQRLGENGNSLFVSRQDSLIYKLESGIPQPIYKIAEVFQLSSLSSSPNDKYLAFINFKDGLYLSEETGRQGKYDILPEVNLRIINRSGDTIHSLPDCLRYVWSPDGNSVAIITYNVQYPEEHEKLTTGLWIYNINTGEKIKAADKANELFWAAHDLCLYFIDYYKGRTTVFKWDPRTGKTEQTDYKDIYFSPDGEYYLSLNKVEHEPVQLYKTSSNAKLLAIEVRERLLPPGVTSVTFPDNLGVLAGGSYLSNLRPWVPDNGHRLLFIKEDVETELAGTGPVKRIVSRTVKSVENYIFDVEKKEVVRQFSGKTTEWISNGKVLALERDGKLVFERLAPEE